MWVTWAELLVGPWTQCLYCILILAYFLLGKSGAEVETGELKQLGVQSTACHSEKAVEYCSRRPLGTTH